MIVIYIRNGGRKKIEIKERAFRGWFSLSEATRTILPFDIFLLLVVAFAGASFYLNRGFFSLGLASFTLGMWITLRGLYAIFLKGGGKNRDV